MALSLRDDGAGTRSKKNGKKKSSSSNSGGFQAMGLSEPVYRGIMKMGFRVPTPVQRKALPVCLSGADTVAMARTGSGKTAAFVIPVLERLIRNELGMASSTGSGNSATRAVILSPTRELCLQTLKVTKTLGKFCKDIKCAGIVGGDSIESQFSSLATKPQIVLATPGRLSHLLREVPDFDMRQCEIVVFDEADRLFEMGFKEQIREICQTMPESRQTMLFSATMPKSLVEFTRNGGLMHPDPTVVRLDAEATVSDELRIGFVTCRSEEKDAALVHLLRDVLLVGGGDNAVRNEKDAKGGRVKGKTKDSKGAERGNVAHQLPLTLVFAATRHHVEYLSTLLRLNHIDSTMIYGTMDHEARKSAISSFRSGAMPVLIVTDVAARGIDIPLIDHVVHHSFPSSAKLFVHRSGRAARAGRIGYCFALVEPDEMPYMVDLHLFLGRRLTSAADVVEDYTLHEMTPDLVHYGSVPESVMTCEMENIHRLVSAQESGHADAEALQSQHRVCTNAMKQFRRSRPNASGEGIRRAKEILNLGGPVPSHPVLRTLERTRVTAGFGEKGLDEIREREEFLRAMSSFRPKETVFEAFSTAATRSGPVTAQVDKGNRAVSSTVKVDNALAVMKSMRRQMRLTRNKGAALVVAGSSSALALNGTSSDRPDSSYSGPDVDTGSQDTDDATDDCDENDGKSPPQKPSVKPMNSVVADLQKDSGVISSNAIIDRKRRLSKAERKHLKKGKSVHGTSNSSFSCLVPSGDRKRTKEMRGADFRDGDNFIDTEQGFDARQREVEASMQPSASEGTDSRSTAMRLEEAMLDIVGDENADIVKQRRMMRWDKSKRKYVQTTLGAEASGMSRSKRLKLESGQIIKDDKAKLGELYDKWQKKTNRSIGRTGVFDDIADTAEAYDEGGTVRGSTSRPKGGTCNEDKHVKTAAEIRKEREKKKDMKIKNMKKGSRARILQKEVLKQKGKKSEKGVSGRWGFKRKR